MVKDILNRIAADHDADPENMSIGANGAVFHRDGEQLFCLCQQGSDYWNEIEAEIIAAQAIQRASQLSLTDHGALPSTGAALTRWISQSSPATYEYNEATRDLAVSVVFSAMCIRAEERGMPAPVDNSGGCKFASMFAKAMFGGAIRGNYDHQFNVIDGEIVDLNDESLDVKKLVLDIGLDGTYLHDPEFFGSTDHIESMLSCIPRVQTMVGEFKARAQELGLEPRDAEADGGPTTPGMSPD